MKRNEFAKDHKPKNAAKLRIGVVVSAWNPDITKNLLAGAQKTLREWHVRDQNIHVLHVAGSFEIPFGCLKLIRTTKFDAIIALGCLIKGETKHDEYIATAVSSGIMNLSLEYRVPIGFGVITANTLAQAKARSSGSSNKGVEAAVAALDLALT